MQIILHMHTVLIAITHTVPVGLQIFPLDGLVLENLRIRRHIWKKLPFEFTPSIKQWTVFLYQINKPIVEKKRRERINACLDELKDLLLQSASKHEVNIDHVS